MTMTQTPWTLETYNSANIRLRSEQYPSRGAAARALPTGKTLRIERLPKASIYRVYLPESAK